MLYLLSIEFNELICQTHLKHLSVWCLECICVFLLPAGSSSSWIPATSTLFRGKSSPWLCVCPCVPRRSWRPTRTWRDSAWSTVSSPPHRMRADGKYEGEESFIVCQASSQRGSKQLSARSPSRHPGDGLSAGHTEPSVLRAYSNKGCINVRCIAGAIWWSEPHC